MPYRYMALVFVFLKGIYISINIYRVFAYVYHNDDPGGYSRSKVTEMIERFWVV